MAGPTYNVGALAMLLNDAQQGSFKSIAEALRAVSEGRIDPAVAAGLTAAGTAQAGRPLVVDSNIDIGGIRRLTVTGGIRIPTRTVAAAGSVQGDGVALLEGLNLVTGADATKGAVLPSAAAGMQVLVKNGAAAILKIWPASADGINAIAVNSAFSIAANTAVLLTALDATTWYSLPLLPS